MSVIGTTLLLFCLLAAENKPTPKLPLGKETTYVTGPLDKEGSIDYETALNDRLAQGITPDKNANVLLYTVFGPAPEGGKGMPPEFFKRLGMKEPPRDDSNFIGIGKYLTAYRKVEQAEINAILDQQGWAGVRPWPAHRYPHIAGWLTANEKQLALLVEATQRPDYFNPLISWKNEQGESLLIGALLSGVQKCRELASALTARAMLRVSEGKFEDAWQDLLACHRLGRLVGRGSTLIESLVGIAIDSIASNADLAYLERVPLTPRQLQSHLKDLRDLPPMPAMADKIDLTERFVYLEMVQLTRRRGLGVLENLFAGGPVKKPDAEELKALEQIDWEPALRDGNRWYDRLADASRLKDRVSREKELNRLETDLKALKMKAATPADLAKLLLEKSPPDKQVGKAIGDVLISQMMPATRKVQSAHDRSEQVQRNLLVAVALAGYHHDHDRYPARLDELVPRYLPTIPGDLFSGQALVYRPTDKGYLVYSVGVNGKDEGGRWYDDEPPGDDLRVRMPLPELKQKK